jgi:hypothetical protein
MKPVFVALVPGLAASPALAHSGAHLHPHSVEGWIVGLAVLVIATAATLAVKARK